MKKNKNSNSIISYTKSSLILSSKNSYLKSTSPNHSLKPYSQLSSIKIVSKDSEFFPKKLYDLPDCPDILFVLGNEKILNNFSISIIGTRKSSNLGNDIAFDLSKNLSDNQITIVSGMATGIDTNAHLGALASKNCAYSTIAIVAHGFNYFSSKNFSLVENIIKNNGAIISEYFPDTPPQKFTYLRRNRLVATMAECVIVIEAPIKSGALNTAQTALKLNRPVFAIPWNINSSTGYGCNFLIENKANILTNYKKILEFFNISEISKKNINTINELLNYPIPERFKTLYDYISQNYPVSKELIYTKFYKESVANINSNLVLMELQNLIKLIRKRILHIYSINRNNFKSNIFIFSSLVTFPLK